MSTRATVLAAATLIGAAWLAPSAAHAQANACDSQAQRAACSEQCCGRRSCPPACEADCVRACVAACKDPGQASSYQNQMRAFQQRCGNRSLQRGQLQSPIIR
jgi:hypothetical protein